MSNSTITFDIAPTNIANPIAAEVWLDDQCIYRQSPCNTNSKICATFDDDIDAAHTLKIVIKDKTPDHTKINSQGEIVEDSSLKISNFQLDDVNIDLIVSKLAVYRHNFNNSSNWTNETFYSTAGCNGTITLNFTTPSYLWLLENI